MPEQFRSPGFLRPEIEPKPLQGEEYGKGLFTVVAKLENLPANVRERVPQGFVVKKYKMSEHDWDRDIEESEYSSPDFDAGLALVSWDLVVEPRVYAENDRESIMFWLRREIQILADKIKHKPTLDELRRFLLEQSQRGELRRECERFLDRQELEKWWKECSLTGMAKELKRRHDLVQAHFKDTLPNLVVDTQFMIGSPDGSREQARLYEVQKQIVPLQSLSKMFKGASEVEYLFGRKRYYEEDVARQYNEYLKNNPIVQAYRDALLHSRDTVPQQTVPTEVIEAARTIAQAVHDELASKPAQLRRLKAELRKFIAQAKTLPKVQDWIPFDLPLLENLVFTEEGLRMIDTNQGVQPSRMTYSEDKEKIMTRYTRALEVLEKIRKNL